MKNKNIRIYQLSEEKKSALVVLSQKNHTGSQDSHDPDSSPYWIQCNIINYFSKNRKAETNLETTGLGTLRTGHKKLFYTY